MASSASRTAPALAALVGTAVLLVLAAAPAAQAAEDSSNKGGAACLTNVQCGIPAANVDSLREDAASITGQCTDGKCECYSFYGCPRCTVTEQPGTGTTVTLTGSTDTIDLCDYPWGGGVCNDDSQCGNGVCIKGRCVCYSNWGCEYCTLDKSQDILAGATCGQYVAGYGACSSDSDCNTPFGVCRNGKCQCGSGYACSHCTRTVSNLIAGTTDCPCDGVDCSGNGHCYKGSCICADGYTGRDCSFDPCKDKTCSGHGTCSRGTGLCVCDDGYGGDDCSTGGGNCDEDKHCGMFGETKFGGYCDENNECQCYEGYTCPTCAGLGEECASARGGGICEQDQDCGFFDGLLGGTCIKTDTDKYWITEGNCRCWPGYTCPNCDIKVADFEAGTKCPSAASTVTVAVLTTAAMMLATLGALLLSYQ